MHSCVIHGSLGLMSLHPPASVSMCTVMSILINNVNEIQKNYMGKNLVLDHQRKLYLIKVRWQAKKGR